MVPHRKVLRAIALASYCNLNSEDFRRSLCDLHRVKFPGSWKEFWEAEIYKWLPPELEAAFLTTDGSLTGDYRPMFAAARVLGVDKYLTVDASGPTIHVPSDVLKWRKHDTIRLAMETMLLCGMSAVTIAEDMRRMWGVTFNEADINAFGDLYVDHEFAAGDNWIRYTQCIGQEEAIFKFRMTQQPRDYVRWQLGVPVALDSDQVLNRLMSDSYFTCQKLKSENENNPSRDELTRIKIERDTIFKCMDRLLKHKELAHSSGSNPANDAASAIGKIVLAYGEQHFVSKDELLGQ